MQNTTEELKAILLLSCPDKIGLVSRISHFIFERGGNILDLDEHVDPVEKVFSIRVAWEMKNFSIPASELRNDFIPLAKGFKATWDIKLSEQKANVAIFVSKYDHCLNEILWRYSIGEFPIEISLIVSNHPDLEPLAKQYQIPYHLFPITKENKMDQEKKELKFIA